jgi:hypothetical protein
LVVYGAASSCKARLGQSVAGTYKDHTPLTSPQYFKNLTISSMEPPDGLLTRISDWANVSRFDYASPALLLSILIRESGDLHAPNPDSPTDETNLPLSTSIAAKLTVKMRLSLFILVQSLNMRNITGFGYWLEILSGEMFAKYSSPLWNDSYSFL